MITVATVRRCLGELAPEKWAQDWDNVGLMVGEPQARCLKLPWP